MKTLAFLLCLMVGGSFAFVGEHCDHSSCKQSSPMQELAEKQFFPNAEELRDLCPKMLEFLDCNINLIESCVGKTLTELEASSNKSVAEGTVALLGVSSLVRDVCNPHSAFHEDYVANVECLRGFAVAGHRLCQMETEETMQDFYTKFNIEKGGLDDTLNAELNCLELAYEVTCFSIRLGESCGETARNMFVTLVRRMRPVMGTRCEGGTSSSLKNKLYAYSDVDDEQMSKIKETIELFKRR